jgi:hypothetical protein
MMVMELVDRAKSEFSAAQTTTEAVEASRERTVIIIGLPWFRTGTGQVMQAQVNYFKRSGGTRSSCVFHVSLTISPPTHVFKEFSEELVN